MTPEIHNLATKTHGRVLLRRAAGDPRGLIVGFHGYLENAAIQLARLETIPGAGAWTPLSIQGLNRVYRGRSQDVVAGWMTREDRADAIADNLAYVTSALKLVVPAPRRIVYAGFSQGGAMAFRAGTMIDGASAIVAVGSDVPPELLSDPSRRFPAVLLARGTRDDWYTAGKHEADVAAFRARGADVESVVYDAPHEWTAELSAELGTWLRRLG